MYRHWPASFELSQSRCRAISRPRSFGRNLIFLDCLLDRRIGIRLIIDDANELRRRTLDVVDGPGVQRLFGQLLRHIAIVTANGTKQLGGGPRLPRVSCYYSAYRRLQC